MLSVIIIWIYMIGTTFLVGYGVLRFLTRHLAYIDSKHRKNPAENETAGKDGDLLCAAAGGLSHDAYGADAYIICGLVCVTVYAQFFSLFAGVGLWANVLLCAACFGIFLREREGILEALEGWLPRRKGEKRARYLERKEGRTGDDAEGASVKTRGNSGGVFRAVKCTSVMLLFLVFAYGTSRGIPHYDTALYHAQSIRWLEEYGAVKGLGNLHCRLAYNSSSFALSALYSMAFLGGQSYHCSAGFLAFLLAAGCLRLVDSLREGKLYASDFARVMCVYYLVNIFDEMISPASDYFMVLTAFYLVITWLSLAERGEREIFPYAILCVLAVFLMTVKLSAALILLLTIYPACRLVKEKRAKETGAYLGLGFVTALPFFIRNALLSGWLVYPFTRIDLLDVVWKIPKGVADYDAREIQVWGRGYSDVTRYDISPKEWLPDWFRGLAGSDKFFVLASALAASSLVVWAGYCLWRCCSLRRQAEGFEMCGSTMSSSASAVCEGEISDAFSERRRSTPSLAFFTLQGTVAASFLFWLCTSPLMRYGCVYVYLTPAVVFGEIYAAIMEAGRRRTERGKGKVSVVDGIAKRMAEGAGNSDSGAGNGRVRTVRWRTAANLCVCAAVCLLLAYKAAALGRGIVSSYENDHWLTQKDYENFAVESCEIEGVTFYYPVTGDQTGYDAFPSAPARPQIAFLGKGLADGFRAADSDAVPETFNKP